MSCMLAFEMYMFVVLPTKNNLNILTERSEQQCRSGLPGSTTVCHSKSFRRIIGLKIQTIVEP